MGAAWMYEPDAPHPQGVAQVHAQEAVFRQRTRATGKQSDELEREVCSVGQGHGLAQNEAELRRGGLQEIWGPGVPGENPRPVTSL